jgi:hypothetical protein
MAIAGESLLCGFGESPKGGLDFLSPGEYVALRRCENVAPGTLRAGRPPSGRPARPTGAKARTRGAIPSHPASLVPDVQCAPSSNPGMRPVSTEPTPMSTGSTPMPGDPTLPIVPGENVQSFGTVRKPGVVYVDKTRFIQRMVSDIQPAFFCAKPRRFGKTLMVSTLEAFFQGRKELFRGLDIEEYMESPSFVECPVLNLRMNGIYCDTGMTGVRKGLLREIDRSAKDLGLTIHDDDPIFAFSNLVDDIYRISGPIALLIDEYDSPLVDTFNEVEIHEKIRKFLKGFYNIVKVYSSCEFIKFIFITGISKFSKLGIFSAMNNLVDISFCEEYGAMHGYTEDEISFYFNRHIEKIANKSSMTQDELKKYLHGYYDGYCFGSAKNIYNPVSVNKFFTTEKFGHYWVETGDQEFIERYFSDKHVSVEEFDNVPIDYREISSPGEVSRGLDPKYFLYQAGYLTVRVDDDQEFDGIGRGLLASNDDSKAIEKKNILSEERRGIDDDGDDLDDDPGYYLTYPNHEVRAAMYSLVTKNYFNSGDNAQIKKDFRMLLKKTAYAEAFLQVNAALKAIPHFDSTIAKRNKKGQWYYRGPVILYFRTFPLPMAG